MGGRELRGLCTQVFPATRGFVVTLSCIPAAIHVAGPTRLRVPLRTFEKPTMKDANYHPRLSVKKKQRALPLLSQAGTPHCSEKISFKQFILKRWIFTYS